jgi:hypothetical protein
MTELEQAKKVMADMKRMIVKLEIERDEARDQLRVIQSTMIYEEKMP